MMNEAMICTAIIEACRDTPEGVPGGTIYAALMYFGLTYEQFEGIMTQAVTTGKLVKRGQLYFATPEGPKTMEKEDTSKAGITLYDLRSRFHQYSQPRTFKVGDFVTQEKSLRAYNYPEDGMPAIVTEIRERHEDKDCSVVSYIDMVIGVLAEGEFVQFATDSRRFVAYK